MTKQAVEIRGACKSYGPSWNSTPVLKNLDMNVPVGSIYGLLGASGCGKTTLLTCIIGQQKLNSGDIFVLGKRPGSRGSGVPGWRVGYMPQELGLLREFTVKRIIYYFGWISNMNNDEIEEQYRFLTQLLDLPQDGQTIKNLSGGEQRRVSFAAALVHKSEILILDEPTVGLDPILRKSIWNYLIHMASEKNIGLMREGKLLAEQTPENLLSLCNCITLEEAFLKLSIQQSKYNASIEEVSHISIFPTETNSNNLNMTDLSTVQLKHEVSTKQLDDDNDEINLQEMNEKHSSSHTNESVMIPVMRRMKALLMKNFLQVLFNPTIILLVVLLPVLQVGLLFYTIGQPPKGLYFAVVNEEIGNYSNCIDFESHHFIGINNLGPNDCHFSGVSCIFLSQLNDSIAKKEYYSSKEEALAAVRTGHAVGAIHFAANFSQELENRYILGNSVLDSTLDYSEIDLYMDMSDHHISIMIQAILYSEYNEFASNLAISCNNNQKATQIPMQFNDAVYGKKYPQFIDYVAPKYIIMVTYFMATSLTTMLIVHEKLDGIWNRNLVTGVTLTEIIISHLLCQITLVIIICTLSLLMATKIHGFQCKGPMSLFVLIVILQGICGMCYGFLISVLCTNFTLATYISIGSLLPFCILSGMIWPIESMNIVLQTLCLFLPSTLANLSINNISDKGWNLMHPQVYSGFLATLAWIIGQSIISLIVLKMKK